MLLKDYCEIHTLSIVFLGDFNPKIIQPFWLASKKLIRDHEAKDANIELIHSELVKFEIEDWVKFEITKTRFELRTSKEPYFIPVKDLALSIYEILAETPIRALGINHIFHFALPNSEINYNFGNKLVPLEPWEGFVKDPRLLNLEIFEKERQDEQEGSFRVRIQPSDQKLSTQFGVAINVNDHFEIPNKHNGRQKEMLAALKNNWDPSMKRASDIIENIWKIVK